MLVVNGYNPGAVFFRAEVAVEPNHYYLFTAWILNLFKVTGYPDPELGVRVLDQAGNPLYAATLGALIPSAQTPQSGNRSWQRSLLQENTRSPLNFSARGLRSSETTTSSTTSPSPPFKCPCSCQLKPQTAR